MGPTYEIALAPPAVRAIRDDLPESVAAAAIEFITGALRDNPHRVGKELRPPLDGVWSARRGTYGVLYRILEGHREVYVLKVDHRRDAYR